MSAISSPSNLDKLEPLFPGALQASFSRLGADGIDEDDDGCSSSSFSSAASTQPPACGYTASLLFCALGGVRGILQLAITIVGVVLLAHNAGASYLVVGITLAVAFVVAFVVQIMQDWKNYGKRDDAMIRASKESSKPFLKREVEIRPHHNIKGAKVWQPKTSIERVKRRGLSTVGTSFLAALRGSCTWSLEYRIQALIRVIKYDLGLGRFVRKHSPENNYHAIMNSVLACYINKDSGHFESYDTILPHMQNQKRRYHKITLELDHDRKMCLRARIKTNEGDSSEHLLDDPNEVGVIVLIVGPLKAHGHVHYFANGVAEAEGVWPLAKDSSDMVQALNVAAVFSVPTATSMPAETTAEILAHNVIAEGLPFHHHLAVLGKNSLTHRMTAKARRGLFKMGVPPPHAESILAATIMHSADHYYFDHFLGFDGRSEFMQSDFTAFRATVVGPINYHTLHHLCKHHLDDPICRVLYEAAHGVDPVFADKWLFMSITV